MIGLVVVMDVIEESSLGFDALHGLPFGKERLGEALGGELVHDDVV